jgi:hypothetical protein
MSASRQGLPLGLDEAVRLEAARDRMIARHRLIERMIANNSAQLKNESARGGAEIERECARRDAAAANAGPEAAGALEAIGLRLSALEDEHRRLVGERDWLNATLLDFESGGSSDSGQVGHA